jgi:hypothetical protein
LFGVRGRDTGATIRVGGLRQADLCVHNLCVVANALSEALPRQLQFLLGQLNIPRAGFHLLERPFHAGDGGQHVCLDLRPILVERNPGLSDHTFGFDDLSMDPSSGEYRKID